MASVGSRLPAFSSPYRAECLRAGASLGLDNVSRVSLLDQETFLVGILHRQDKMSMAASIESRVPFMDYRLVEFANSLPSEYKLRSGAGKAIVKDVARDYLPAEIVDRRKSGFGVPLARWFRNRAASANASGRYPTVPRPTGSIAPSCGASSPRIATARRPLRVPVDGAQPATWRETFGC